MARGMKSFLRPLDIRRPGLKNLVHPRREPLRERLVPVVAAPFRFPAPPRFSEGRKLSLLTELHAKKVDLFLHQQGLDTSTPRLARARQAGTHLGRKFTEDTKDGSRKFKAARCDAVTSEFDLNRHKPSGASDRNSAVQQGHADP